MYEQNDTPSEQPTGRKQDAIEISDFVYAATGARLRRLTMPDGTHWFPAVDVCKHLGYAHAGSALRNVADATNFASAETVLQAHCLSIPAGREWRRDMNLVNLQGLIRLANGCTKPESQPFKAWVSEVIATLQRDGTYTLDPAPVQPAPHGGTAYLMPEQVADAIIRLEERNIRADEALAVAQVERIEEMRRTNDHLGRTNDHLAVLSDRVGGVHHVLGRIADTLDLIADRTRPATPAPPPPTITPSSSSPPGGRRTWSSPSTCTPSPPTSPRRWCVGRLDRVHDCLRMLIKRGCVRQAGVAAEGVPVYVLP